MRRDRAVHEPTLDHVYNFGTFVLLVVCPVSDSVRGLPVTNFEGVNVTSMNRDQGVQPKTCGILTYKFSVTSHHYRSAA